jgi:hypothetical protein
MFSTWFSGDECGQYRTSSHKQRMDHVASSLLELRYANEVIRQHLHEWLGFSRHLEKRGLLLPAAPAFFVPQSESSSKQTKEDSFADVLATLLSPLTGLPRF